MNCKLLQRMGEWVAANGDDDVSRHCHNIHPTNQLWLNQINGRGKWGENLQFYPKGISHFNVHLLRARSIPLSSLSSLLALASREWESSLCVHTSFQILQCCVRTAICIKFTDNIATYTFEMKRIGAQVTCYDDDDDDEDMTANCCDNKIGNPLYLHCEQEALL